MKKISKLAYDFLEVLAVLCFLILSGLVFLQIGGRWGGLNNLGWTDEIISCFTGWMVYLGYAYMCGRDEHICITMLQDAVPRWLKTILVLIVRVMNILCGAAILYGGLKWTESTATKLTPNLQINYNLWYNAIWICSIIFIIFAAIKLIETIIALFAPVKTEPEA